MKRVHLDCSCHSLTHLVRFDIDPNSEHPFFCITYHLNNERSIWRRLVEAVRHIFVRGGRYEDLELLRSIEDRADLLAMAEADKDPGPNVAWEDLKKELDL
jgi:hypothetical protein